MVPGNAELRPRVVSRSETPAGSIIDSAKQAAVAEEVRGTGRTIKSSPFTGRERKKHLGNGQKIRQLLPQHFFPDFKR